MVAQASAAADRKKKQETNIKRNEIDLDLGLHVGIGAMINQRKKYIRTSQIHNINGKLHREKDLSISLIPDQVMPPTGERVMKLLFLAI